MCELCVLCVVLCAGWHLRSVFIHARWESRVRSLSPDSLGDQAEARWAQRLRTGGGWRVWILHVAPGDGAFREPSAFHDLPAGNPALFLVLGIFGPGWKSPFFCGPHLVPMSLSPHRLHPLSQAVLPSQGKNAQTQSILGRFRVGFSLPHVTGCLRPPKFHITQLGTPDTSAPRLQSSTHPTPEGARACTVFLLFPSKPASPILTKQKHPGGQRAPETPGNVGGISLSPRVPEFCTYKMSRNICLEPILQKRRLRSDSSIHEQLSWASPPAQAGAISSRGHLCLGLKEPFPSLSFLVIIGITNVRRPGAAHVPPFSSSSPLLFPSPAIMSHTSLA